MEYFEKSLKQFAWTVKRQNNFWLSPFILSAILITFKSVAIFADFVLISAKMTTLLKEMRSAQLSSENERTLTECFITYSWRILRPNKLDH